MKSQPTNRQFDHEKLEVYRQQLALISWVTELFEEIANAGGVRLREVSDQLDRASISTLLNIAEGNGKRRKQVRAKFFDDARGSATECAACLDVLVVKRACAADRIAEGKEYLLSVVSMLTRLVELFDGSDAVHETSADYLVCCAIDGGSEEEKEKEEEED